MDSSSTDAADERGPEVRRARFGPKGKGDRFVGFWLELIVQGRQAKLRPDPRAVRRAVERLFRDRDVQAAIAAVGEPAVTAELADAAATYFQSCLDDPTYSTMVWGMNRLSPEQLRTKASRDAADALLMLAASGALDGHAAALPGAWVDGFAEVFGAPGEAALRTEVSQRPQLAPVASSLWPDGTPRRLPDIPG